MRSLALGPRCFTIALSVLALTPAGAEAVPILLQAVDDRRGLDSLPIDEVFGLQTDPGANTIVVSIFNNQISFQERLGMEFNLASVPAGSTVTAATLLLNVSSNPLQSPYQASVHGYIGDGVVQGADLATNNFLTDFSAIAAGSLVIPLPVAFVQTALDNNDLFLGFALRSITLGTALSLTSLQCNGCDGQYPQLLLDVEPMKPVPEPATLVLLGSGLAAGWRVRARRAHRKV